MKPRTKTTVLFLAAVLASALAACGETESIPETDTQTMPSESAELTTEGTEENIPAVDVPEMDYEGHNFVFFITGNTTTNWEKNDFKADGETGEVLNDARFRRNTAIEERFNITISTHEMFGPTSGKGPGYRAISKAVMANDTSYDACMIASYDCATLSCSGYLYDLNAMPYVDITKPWWDQKINFLLFQVSTLWGLYQILKLPIPSTAQARIFLFRR